MGCPWTELAAVALLSANAGVQEDCENIPEVVLASTFSADYTVYPYAYVSAAISDTHPFHPKGEFGPGLHADSGSDASHRVIHHGEREKNHATCLGNVMCADFVAFDVRLRNRDY